jgi:hypothetical protein
VHKKSGDTTFRRNRHKDFTHNKKETAKEINRPNTRIYLFFMHRWARQLNHDTK